MKPLLTFAIKLLLWLGLPALMGFVAYKIDKHDTDLMNEEIDRIERQE